MQDDSLSEINSQHDSDVEPVQKNVDFSDVTPVKPSYVPAPKTGGYCPLGSHLGKTPIGAPSTINVVLKQIEVEETVSDKPKQFTDIISHKARPMGFANIDAFERDHPLKKIFEKTSWNNIPLPLKDCLQAVINAIASNEVKDWKRKQVINERFMKVYMTCDKLKDRLKLVLAESRAQGVFIQEQIADIGPTCMQGVEAQFALSKKELVESGQKIREQQQQMSFDIKTLVRGNTESMEKVDTQLNELAKIIDELKEELPYRMEKNTRDYMKAWQKIPQEGSASLDIKEYLTLMPQKLGIEIKQLEGKLVLEIEDTRQGVQQTITSRIDQLAQQQLEVDAQILMQTKLQIDNIQNQLEVQTTQLRQEIKNESAQLRADEEDRRMRERPTSADLKEKEQRELDLFKELTASGGGKDDPVNNKLANIVKMITRLQEELLPQKIQRAIEQFEGKLEVQAAKQKKLVKDSIGKVEKEQTSQGVRLEGFVMSQVDALKAKLGSGFTKMIQSKIELEPVLSSENPSQNSIKKQELNKKETLELLSACEKTQVLNSMNSESKISSKRSEQQSPVGDYMEIFVSQNIKNRCDPLDDLGVTHGLILKDVQKQIDQLGGRISKVDTHFNQTIRAICSTMGLVIRDVSGFTIQQEYIKKLDNEQKNREKLKLGANVQGKNDYFKVMQQNESEHHSSIEGDQSDENISASLESVEQLNKSIDSSKPKHWRVIEKKFNLKGIEQSFQLDSQIRTNQSIDDSIYEKPKSQERQFEVLSTRQQVVHSSGKSHVSTLQENFLPVLKPVLGKRQEAERFMTTVQMTERYQKKAEFSKLQFPDVTQAQRSVHEGPRQSQGAKKNNFPQTPTRSSVHQSGVGSASLNIRRGKLPNK